MNRDNYVTILAIYDDPPQPVISSSGSSPTIITVDKTIYRQHPDAVDGVVEITNLNEPPSYGLKVVPEAPSYSGGRNSPFLPQHRSELSSSTTASFRRSPTSESFKKPFQSNSSGSSRQKESNSNNMAENLSRSQARKSRFTEAFLDARDRLEENNETFLNITDPNLRQMKVILAVESVKIPLGIEISAVPDLNDSRKTRILAVEVRKIDDDGRVAIDGRIKVGDQITDINHRPVYQMSLPAAQARLHELQFVEEPVLVVTRRTGDEINDSAPKALKTTALQQANTTKTGDVLSVFIKKSSAGFGFGVKSRVNTRAETLICINSVSINGPAYNKLQIGDRLLKINDTEVATFSQADVVGMLKKTAVGSTVTFCISRMANENENIEFDAPQQSTSSTPNKTIPESLEMVHKRRQSAFVDILDENVEFLTFDVQLINSRSAGLGISLKGGKLYPESGKLENGVDCGLFVKGILHGSAAFHDGRFHESDRLIGIENLDLREYKHNADALAAFTNRLGNVPLQQRSVKIHVARCKDYPAIDFGRKSSMKNKTTLTAHADGYESEISLAPDSEAFNRENRTRKSISEKKHPFGGGKDVIHAQAYQKILHQRQTSAPQFPSESSSITASNEFKKRRTSLSHRLPLSIAPQLIDLEISPNENSAPFENDHWVAFQKLQKSKQRQSMFIESSTREKPFQVQSLKSMKGQSASKLAPLSQLFQHLKGSKKDKSRRHTIYVASHNNDVIIEPLKSVENNFIMDDEDGKKEEECKNS
uniref:PDZ domain-containing protein n=1 Tax=Panagrolaimus superbus TaxID=310955 RepID=A0A914XVG2_9BILA